MHRSPVVPLLLAAVCGWTQPDYAPLSVAAPGGFRTARINPAALATGEADGIALALDFSGALQSGRIERSFEDLSLAVSLGGIGYSYQQDDPVHRHTLALAHPLARNLYAGAAARLDASGVEPLGFDLGLLYRPIDYLSLGGVAEVPVEGAAAARLGLGLRPFAFHPYLADRLTLTADLSVGERSWTGPELGLQTEFIDGLGLDIGFDFERNSLSAALSISSGHVRSGTRLGLDADNRPASGEVFLHLSPRLYRPSSFGPAYFLDRSPGPQDHFVDYEPGPRIVEEKPGRFIGPFFVTGEGQTLREVLEQVKRLSEDRQIAGILFRDRNLETSYADLFELREALQAFRATGRRVVFYYEAVDNLNYALAAAVGDRVYLHPHGYLDLRGFAISRPYLKGLFDALGVDIENFRSHEAKTAFDFLSEPRMSPTERQNLESFLDGEYRELISLIRQGRGTKLSRPVEELVERGPFLVAEDALAAGLVDELVYEDQLPARLKELAALTAPEPKVIRPAAPALAGRVRYDWSDPPRDKVAYIAAIGSLHRGESQPGVSAGSDTLARAVREARRNPSVRGILLRVDSPGGSALAADVVAREVALCREGPDAKPVVVSMAGTAASGGYYIAAPAYRIVAQPVTLTGSIGVVSVSADLSELFENLMIHWDTVKRGEQADMGALYRPLSEEERARIRRGVEDSYQKFLTTVAAGREMDREAVHRVAQGRIWTGLQARERRLVDELGGLQTARTVMKELLGTGHELLLVPYPSPGIPIPLGAATRSKAARPRVPAGGLEPILDLYREFSRYGGERLLMILPYRFDLQGPANP